MAHSANASGGRLAQRSSTRLGELLLDDYAGQLGANRDELNRVVFDILPSVTEFCAYLVKCLNKKLKATAQCAPRTGSRCSAGSLGGKTRSHRVRLQVQLPAAGLSEVSHDDWHTEVAEGNGKSVF